MILKKAEVVMATMMIRVKLKNPIKRMKQKLRTRKNQLLYHETIYTKCAWFNNNVILASASD
jgi:hypothetical protein